jgi:hypothetical protein
VGVRYCSVSFRRAFDSSVFSEVLRSRSGR